VAAANVAGAVVVFLFLVLALPVPHRYRHAWLLGVNGGVLALSALVGVPLASTLLSRIWRERTQWLIEGREPTERERALTLRFPIDQHALIAALWILDALIFAVLNAFFSVQLAADVAITVVLGGLVMVALGYLLSEWLLRPITALALETGLPARPQLPGVAARALLSWTLGTGVVLLGLVLVGASGLSGDLAPGRVPLVVVVLASIGLIVGLVAMIGLARSLAGPIEALRVAVGQVERGEFDHEVTVDDGSEVGMLQAGFNRMLAGLRERERIRDLFGRQVGEDVVSHALEHGVVLGGEAREAAVLFVDLEGSTRLAHDHDPGEVVALLNAFFAVVVEVVTAQGGWVNKFEGDAALCVFGAPMPDRACASKALAAGRELSARLQAELPSVRAGIGVSAGRVVAGNVGAAKRFEYTVIGDPVNEAARLSELAKREAGGVLASGAALERADTGEPDHWRVTGQRRLRGRASATALAVPVGMDAEAPAEARRASGRV
jgi:adenylate cyclase